MRLGSPRTAHSSPSTCSRGKWTCRQSAHCSSTCALYGEGHVVTFDGQRFVFDGNCEYILATVRLGGGTGHSEAWGQGATVRPGGRGPGGLHLSTPSPQDGCGANDSQPTFRIVTENVVCGKSGVTCSRAIRISLGVSGPEGVPAPPPSPRSWLLVRATGSSTSRSRTAWGAVPPDAWLSLRRGAPCPGASCRRQAPQGRCPAQSWPAAGAGHTCPSRTRRVQVGKQSRWH